MSTLIRLPLIPRLLTQSKGRFVHQNLPILDLHAWELSNNQSEIKNFLDQEEHLHKKPTMQNGPSSLIGFIQKKLNLISAPITVIADFFIFLFLEKKCQISTIKGYRAMISNTLKFKTGKRIGSNAVLSELIRSFKLQLPVQRSLTPKWDLSWVLVSLQKPPFEPLDKASKFHITIKTDFLLDLATAKRCSEIHALAMDSQYLRFNQTDGSVSLMLKTGFLERRTSFLLLNQTLLLFLVLLEYVKGNIWTGFFAPLGLCSILK